MLSRALLSRVPSMVVCPTSHPPLPRGPAHSLPEDASHLLGGPGPEQHLATTCNTKDMLHTQKAALSLPSGRRSSFLCRPSAQGSAPSPGTSGTRVRCQTRAPPPWAGRPQLERLPGCSLRGAVFPPPNWCMSCGETLDIGPATCPDPPLHLC